MPVVAEPDPRALVSFAGAMLAGPANVVLQLARPGVGRGVVESTVDSGKITERPLKRTRTTFTYLAVALLGDETDRRLYRAAVDGSHRAVRSAAGAPVRYNAFDPELQLWVAACLAWGTADVVERLRGPLDAASAEVLLRHCARFGTTLQVRADSWPGDRAAFAAYWADGLQRAAFDDEVRTYLRDLVDVTFLPAPLPRLLGPVNRFVTAGFLPPPVRAAMGYGWTAAQQRRFDRALRAVGRVESALPVAVRVFPFTALLWDLRRRARAGRPLV